MCLLPQGVLLQHPALVLAPPQPAVALVGASLGALVLLALQLPLVQHPHPACLAPAVVGASPLEVGAATLVYKL
jgi:hypothetical protein